MPRESRVVHRERHGVVRLVDAASLGRNPHRGIVRLQRVDEVGLEAALTAVLECQLVAPATSGERRREGYRRIALSARHVEARGKRRRQDAARAHAGRRS